MQFHSTSGDAGKLLLSTGTTGYTSTTAGSGLAHVYAGTFKGDADTWTASSALLSPPYPFSTSSSFTLAAGDYDFPPLSLPADYDPATHVAVDDMRGFLTGIYASPVGCLCTHKNCVVDGQTLGQIGTSINRPDRGYANNYNFFDPDNYISTSALLFSMDP